MIQSNCRARSASFAVVVGLAGVLGLGCSANVDPAAGEAPSAAYIQRWPPPPPPTVLYSCTDITQPGTYWLGGAVNAPAGQPCMQIHSQGPVTLDCRNNEINTAFPGSYPLVIQNSQSFTVQNCNIGSTAEYNGADVLVQSSSHGAFTSNFFARSPVATDLNDLVVNNSNAITFSSNTFAVGLDQLYTTNSNVTNNSFSCASAMCGSLLKTIRGSGNVFSNNTFDGRTSTDQRNESTGTDDAIIIEDETADTVSGNKISNVYDCGVETFGTVTSSTFSNNTITNASTCGIGGWYYMSFANNLVQGNTVSGSANLFAFFRSFGLRPYNWDGHGSAADAGVYFLGNTFTGNSITNVYPASDIGAANGYSAFIPFNRYGQYLAYTGTVRTGETVPAPNQFYMSNNTFTNNNFGPVPAFLGAPAFAGAVTDAGGNVCVKSGLADYPLACGR
jgi:hypothetical protein